MRNQTTRPSASSSRLTLKVILVSVGLSLFLLASSSYIALKIGALPWPIVFSVIMSGGLLTLFSSRRNRPGVHQINIAQAGASVGGLVAAGVAFTLPGVLYLNQTKGTHIDPPDPWMLGVLIALAGVSGVLLSLPLKTTFIDRENLPFPAGTAGAELLKLGKTGGSQLASITAVGSAAAIFALLRELYFPASATTLTVLIPLGVYLTLLPMPLAVGSGYILGPRASLSWLAGAAVGWLGIIPLLIHRQWEFPLARSFTQNLGMGMVLGAGIAFLVAYVLPRIKAIIVPLLKTERRYLVVLPFVSCLAALALNMAGAPWLAALLTIAGTWLMVAVAARMTGETNINPLEQFGIFIGLLIALLFQALEFELSLWSSFLIVIFVSVATAVAGDVGHDYKSAQIIGTDFRSIVAIDLITAAVAGFAAPFVFETIRAGFAEQLFTADMPAPQARMVAGSILGFAFPAVFWSGFTIAFVGEMVNQQLPERFRNRFLIMPFGIGVFLGLGFALPIAAGSLIRMYIDGRKPHLYHLGLLIAAGVMGGEGIAGFMNGALVSAGLPGPEGSAILIAVFLFLGIAALIRQIRPRQS